jgi:hypothetical protein
MTQQTIWHFAWDIGNIQLAQELQGLPVVDVPKSRMPEVQDGILIIDY